MGGDFLDTEPIIERELFLIRHGQSLGNLGAVAPDASPADREDSRLSPLGCAQAARLGQFYADCRFDAVYSSGLLRAVQTAAGLLAGQAQPPALTVEPLLTEIGIAPDYAGRSPNELLAAWPHLHLPDAPLLRSNEFHDEGAAFARARALLDALFTRYRNGEKVALISHAGFLTFVIFDLIGYHDHQPFDFKLANTGVTHVIFYQPGTNPYGDMVFQCVNDRSHLVGLNTETE